MSDDDQQFFRKIADRLRRDVGYLRVIKDFARFFERDDRAAQEVYEAAWQVILESHGEWMTEEIIDWGNRKIKADLKTGIDEFMRHYLVTKGLEVELDVSV